MRSHTGDTVTSGDSTKRTWTSGAPAIGFKASISGGRAGGVELIGRIVRVSLNAVTDAIRESGKLTWVCVR
jgi:hypothetical protein